MTLPTEIYSPDVLSVVIAELRSQISDWRQAATKAKVTGKQVDVSATASDQLRTVFAAAGMQKTDIASMEKLLEWLENTRQEAPVVHLLLASLPNRSQKRQLVEWFRKHTHPAILLTFAVRTDIGGGLVLQAGSHMYDMSFRSRLLENKKRIGEIFENV